MGAPLILTLKKKIDLLTMTVLWEGSENDINNITLNDNISNYKRLKIFFHDADSQYCCQEIYNNNSNEIFTSVFSVYNSGQWFNLKMKSIGFSGNKGVGRGMASIDLFASNVYYDDNIIFDRIEGYKN